MNGIEPKDGDGRSAGNAPATPAAELRLEPVKTKKRRWLNLLVPVALLVAIAYWIDLRAVGSALMALSAGVLLAAFLLATLDRFMMTYKWRQLVLSAGGNLPFLTALRIHYQSMVSGRVVPLPLGADVLRAWLAAKSGISEGLVLSSIVIEKLVAMLAATLMALAGLFFLLGQLPPAVDQRVVFALIAVSLCTALAALSLILLSGAHRLGRRVFQRVNRRNFIPARITGLLRKASQSLLLFRRRRAALFRHFLLALVEYALQLVKLTVLAAGLGIPDAGASFAAVAAVALFARRIAGIVEGWALGEGSAIVALALLGVDAELAVALLLANFAISTVAVLPGLVLFYTHPVELRTGAAGT